MSDLVSIIMPSYNTGRFIKETIDNTDDVVSQYIDDDRICYIKNSVNSGAAVSRNRALCEAKGKWIAFLDSDDVWEVEKLEKQIAFMQDNGYCFSYTNYIEMDEKSIANGMYVTGPKRITKHGMYNYCWPGCLTVMYDAEAIGLIQIADIKKNNDYAMWLQAIDKADCYLLKENLAQYRKRVGSISNHSYWKLIKWHYRLFKESDNKSVVKSAFLTLGNLVWGVFKKIYYVGSVDR